MKSRLTTGDRNRKLLHLLSGIIAPAYWLAGREISLLVLGILTVFMLIAEIVRAKSARGAALYQRYYGAMTRPKEAHRLTGATYLVAAAWLTIMIFPPAVAIPAILFMSWADPVAAVVGQRYGKISIGSKTLEGSAACLVVCLLITIPADLPLTAKLAGALSATLAELAPWGVLDDNLAVPLVSGGTMLLLMSTGL